MPSIFLPDRDQLRVKIEFLIRTILTVANTCYHQQQPKEKIDEAVSLFASCGAAILHLTRIPGVLNLSGQEHATSTSVKKLIVESLNDTIKNVFESTQGVPGLFRITQQEVAIHKGIEKLTDELMIIYTPAEDKRPEQSTEAVSLNNKITNQNQDEKENL
jgi:hypothetical protein